MKKRRKIKLPGGLGRLLIPKNGNVEKLKKRYPEEKYTLTAVVTTDGEPVGFLAKRIKEEVVCSVGPHVRGKRPKESAK